MSWDCQRESGAPLTFAPNSGQNYQKLTDTGECRVRNSPQSLKADVPSKWKLKHKKHFKLLMAHPLLSLPPVPGLSAPNTAGWGVGVVWYPADEPWKQTVGAAWSCVSVTIPQPWRIWWCRPLPPLDSSEGEDTPFPPRTPIPFLLCLHARETPSHFFSPFFSLKKCCLSFQ